MPPKRRGTKSIAKKPYETPALVTKRLEEKLDWEKQKRQHAQRELEDMTDDMHSEQARAEANLHSVHTLLDIIQRARDEAHGTECTDVYAFMEENFPADRMRQCKNCGAYLNPFKAACTCGNCLFAIQ